MGLSLYRPDWSGNADLTFFGLVCPVTLLARRYSTSRQATFDIYLPNWLARYNKEIYSVLVLIALIILGYRFIQPHF